MRSLSLAAFALAASLAIGCSQPTGAEDPIVGAEEPDDSADQRDTESVVGSVSVGSTLVTNANLNLRSSPSKSGSILHVIPNGASVTVVSATPKNGWYNIKHGGQVGWSSGVYLEKAGSSGGSTSGIASCSPSRAAGIVSSSRKALLDTIAYAEGTRGYSQDGYNVLFNFVTISDCNHHPNRTICSGSYCSTAAGRYQFLTATWNSLKLPNFRPENQTQGAMTLISWRKATVPSDRPLTATEFSNVMDRISYEWASLPPGRYGQPMKSMSTLRAQYCKFAGC
jgi:muramidase (phage lysozyme)